MNWLQNFIQSSIGIPSSLPTENQIAAGYAGMANPNVTGPELGQYLMMSPDPAQRQRALNYMLDKAGEEFRTSEQYRKNTVSDAQYAKYMDQGMSPNDAYWATTSDNPGWGVSRKQIEKAPSGVENKLALLKQYGISTPTNISQAILGRPNVVEPGQWGFVSDVAPEIAERMDPTVASRTQMNKVTGELRELPARSATEAAQQTRENTMEASFAEVSNLVDNPNFDFNWYENLMNYAANTPGVNILAAPLFQGTVNTPEKIYAAEMNRFITATRGYASGATVPYREFLTDMMTYGIQPGDDTEMRQYRVNMMEKRINEVQNRSPDMNKKQKQNQAARWREQDQSKIDAFGASKEYTTSKGNYFSREDIAEMMVKYKKTSEEIIQALEAQY